MVSAGARGIVELIHDNIAIAVIVIVDGVGIFIIIIVVVVVIFSSITTAGNGSIFAARFNHLQQACCGAVSWLLWCWQKMGEVNVLLLHQMLDARASHAQLRHVLHGNRHKESSCRAHTTEQRDGRKHNCGVKHVTRQPVCQEAQHAGVCGDADVEGEIEAANEIEIADDFELCLALLGDDSLKGLRKTRCVCVCV